MAFFYAKSEEFSVRALFAHDSSGAKKKEFEAWVNQSICPSGSVLSRLASTKLRNCLAAACRLQDCSIISDELKKRRTSCRDDEMLVAWHYFGQDATKRRAPLAC
jgi:hypothetical protein